MAGSNRMLMACGWLRKDQFINFKVIIWLLQRNLQGVRGKMITIWNHFSRSSPEIGSRISRLKKLFALTFILTGGKFSKKQELLFLIRTRSEFDLSIVYWMNRTNPLVVNNWNDSEFNQEKNEILRTKTKLKNKKLSSSHDSNRKINLPKEFYAERSASLIRWLWLECTVLVHRHIFNRSVLAVERASLASQTSLAKWSLRVYYSVIL